MTVRTTMVENDDRSFTLLAEQDVPVTLEEFEHAFGRPRDMGRWFGVEFTWPTSPDHQLAVGSALEFRASVGPLPVDFTLIVADRVPGESLMFRTTRGCVDMLMEYTWHATATGVSVQMRTDYRVRGALWWKLPWTRAMSRRYTTRGLEAMRRDLVARHPVARAATRSTESHAAGAAHAPGGVPSPRTAPAHRKAPRRHRPQRA
ncbi:hypothetical protein [Kocuria sp.]|uniref:hypothetical protein n=1 Tax=Kocuria sp. TaxID=1871328 RepID=UPI0026DD4CD2|nr:hypothetical protein [Kocuria sp.]MDO4917924.1 hypothetical protein [Kocuria sp.]